MSEKAIDVKKDCIPTYNSDKKILDNYSSLTLIDDVLSTCYSYYKHDLLKLSRLAEQVARLIEYLSDVPKYQSIRSYSEDTFKNRIILVLRYDNETHNYSARDVIYTVRSFMYHGGKAKKDRIDILREFFLGLKCDVFLYLTAYGLHLSSSSDLQIKPFELEEGNINNHMIPMRDTIVLSILIEVTNLLENKNISDIPVSYPPKGFVLRSDRGLVSKLQDYYEKLDPSKLDGKSPD